ncbi:MAG: DUF4433 domain-containing protein [Gammaproteobacteria bacterium]|nr:DUF4433 domain-containing protein [Gammaproteobacteria bacterium]
MPPPATPKIYHIVHVDRLASILSDASLWCDADVQRQTRPGTTIGIEEIKQRRLINPVKCHGDLRVGDCVPFNFCSRSVMLYVIYMGNHPELTYRGGQKPIVHLEAELHEAVTWAHQNERRWAFTLSNAGSGYFEDRCDLAQLQEIDWEVIEARDWRGHADSKQAEFLLERSFPWHLIRRIGVFSQQVQGQVLNIMQSADHRPPVAIKPEWYY